MECKHVTIFRFSINLRILDIGPTADNIDLIINRSRGIYETEVQIFSVKGTGLLSNAVEQWVCFHNSVYAVPLVTCLICYMLLF